jgi:hypothetical protein
VPVDALAGVAGTGRHDHVLAVTAYYPFDWDPPRTVRSDVTRTADGALRFGESNAANSQGTPVWLEEARMTGRVEVDLEVRPLVAQVHGPLSIMLATNYWQTDFAIGQNRSDLLVWLRRLGSDGDGGPAFVVSDVFHARRWTRLRLRVEGANLRIDVDSTMRFLEPVPKGSLRQWGDARVALGGKPGGGGAWPGEIHKAEIRTGGHAVDYVRPVRSRFQRATCTFPTASTGGTPP